MFDRSKQLTLKGTVKEYQWTNPHVFVELVVVGTGGVAENWSIESAPVNMLYRQGWRPDSFKAGDQVTIIVNPLLSGTHGGYFVYGTLPNGKTLGSLNSKPPG